MSYAFKVKKPIVLAEVETKEDGGLTEEQARALTVVLGNELEHLQELMYAAGKHSLLIILQGRDTAGKDGTIRGLSRYFNLLNVRVKSFKVPTSEEHSHDFLWRAHPHAPAKGTVSIFNRSYYEDVIVVRVHDLAPKHIWKARYKQINDFEKLLESNDTIILKFCLHISKDEQRQRLLEREKEESKAWKLSVGDWKERDFWADYSEAYSDAVSKCSPKHARWHVVASDHKWFRDLAITEAIVEALRPLKSEWIEILEQMGKAAKAELDAYRIDKKQH